MFTPNPTTNNRSSGRHCVHTESWHQQQNLWMTPHSHRILPPATDPLGDNVFTPNTSTSNRTSGWHRVQIESWHQQQSLWMTCSHRILPPATKPLHGTVFRPNSSTCNKIPVPAEKLGYGMNYWNPVFHFQHDKDTFLSSKHLRPVLAPSQSLTQLGWRFFPRQ